VSPTVPRARSPSAVLRTGPWRTAPARRADRIRTTGRRHSLAGDARDARRPVRNRVPNVRPRNRHLAALCATTEAPWTTAPFHDVARRKRGGGHRDLAEKHGCKTWLTPGHRDGRNYDNSVGRPSATASTGFRVYREKSTLRRNSRTFRKDGVDTLQIVIIKTIHFIVGGTINT